MSQTNETTSVFETLNKIDAMYADDEPEFEEPRHNFTVRFFITAAEHEKMIALLDASGIPYSGYNGG